MKYIQKMFENKQILKKMLENAETIYNRLYTITRNIKKEGRRLIKDMIFGFSREKTISLLGIAKVSVNNNTKNKVSSFSKFLTGETPIKYTKKYINYVIKQLWKDKKLVYIAIDGWDIRKDYSKNKAMSKVHDWSKGEIVNWVVIETGIAFNERNANTYGNASF